MMELPKSKIVIRDVCDVYFLLLWIRNKVIEYGGMENNPVLIRNSRQGFFYVED